MPEICVIIAAHDAAGTIGGAIASALREPEVAEVVVVDDASQDGTAAAALAADDGSGRLKLLRLEVNGGPSRARNLAMAASSAPILAILDADDALLPGRFARLRAQMLARPDWDLVADNLVLLPESRRGEAPGNLPDLIPDLAPDPQWLDPAGFIAGNIPRPGASRSELGLLKPLIRRSALEARGLRYDEGLRLGEDFILYLRLMARGARFLTLKSCGYLAYQRPHSLSVCHRSADLKAFSEAARAILAEEALAPAARRLLIAQEAFTRAKYRQRAFLDRKAEAGIRAAWRAAEGGRLTSLRLIARDKCRAWLGRFGARARPEGLRVLMPGREG